MERSYRRQPRGASSTDAHRESTDDGNHASAPLAPLATAKPPALATAGPGWSAAAAYPAPLPPTRTSVVRVTTCVQWGAGWPSDAVTAAQWHRRVE